MKSIFTKFFIFVLSTAMATPHIVASYYLEHAPLSSPAWGPASPPMPVSTQPHVQQPQEIKNPPIAAKFQRPSILGEFTPSISGKNGMKIDITDINPRIITNEKTVNISGQVTNTSPKPMKDLSFQAALTPWSFPSIETIGDFLIGSAWNQETVANNDLPGILDPGETHPFSFTVPTKNLPLNSTFQWGARGVTITGRAKNTDMSKHDVATSSLPEPSGKGRSILIWDSGFAAQPTPMNVVIPLTLSNATGKEEQWRTLHSLGHETGTTLAIDPAALALFSHNKEPETLGVRVNAPAEHQTQETPGSSAPSASPTAPDHNDQPQSAATPGWPKSTRRDTPSWWHASSTLEDLPTVLNSLVKPTQDVIALPFGDSDLPFFINDAAQNIPKADHFVKLAQKSKALLTSPSPRGPSAPHNSLHLADNENLSSGPEQEEPHVIDTVLWPTSTSFHYPLIQQRMNPIIISPPDELPPHTELAFHPNSRVELTKENGHTSVEGANEKTQTVLTSSSSISDLLSWEPQNPADVFTQLQMLSAVGSVISRELPNDARPQLVTVARGTRITDKLLARIQALLNHRWISKKSFSYMSASEPSMMERTLPETFMQSTDTDSSTIAKMGNISDIAKILHDATDHSDQLVASAENQELLCQSTEFDVPKRRHCVDDLYNDLDSLRQSVYAKPSATVNLINKTATLPVRVTNQLTWPISVEVNVKPSDSRLQVKQPQVMTIPAHSTSTAQFEVTAIGSGNIDVRYTVKTVNGLLLDDSQSVIIRLQAQWEDIVTGAIATLLILAVIVGITRRMFFGSIKSKELKLNTTDTEGPHHGR